MKTSIKNVSQITELESGTPIIQPPFLFNDTFQINVLNRNLSLLSSLVPISVENSRNANFQQVQNIENDTIEVLDGLKRVEVAENLRTYIRLEPMEYEVQLPYADGISSLYIKECIKIITDFYSHI